MMAGMRSPLVFQSGSFDLPLVVVLAFLISSLILSFSVSVRFLGSLTPTFGILISGFCNLHDANFRYSLTTTPNSLPSSKKSSFIGIVISSVSASTVVQSVLNFVFLHEPSSQKFFFS